MKIWDIDERSRIYSRRFSTSELDLYEVRDAAFGCGGSLAVVTRTGVEIWDGEYKCQEQIGGDVRLVRWSQDGERLAFACRDNTVRLWANDEIVLGRHESLVTSLAWSPDGILASGASDRMVILWDPVAKTELCALTHPYSVQCVEIDRGAARVVACCGGQITVWASRASRLLTALRCICTRLQILRRQRKAVELGECTEDRAAYWIRKACDSRVSELIFDALAHSFWY